MARFQIKISVWVLLFFGILGLIFSAPAPDVAQAQ